MEKIDYKKLLKEYYTAKSEPKLVKVQKLKYITILGQGDPNTSDEFQNAVEALYPVAYKLKFMIKKGETKIPATDFTVMPLEGQWWSDNMNDFITAKKNSWKWKLMLKVPEELDETILDNIKNIVRENKNPVSLSKLKLECLEDGTAAQIMHLGSYDDEAETVEKLHKYIDSNGFKKSGIHREIYLGDPRKADKTKLKTIIRQPYI